MNASTSHPRQYLIVLERTLLAILFLSEIGRGPGLGFERRPLVVLGCLAAIALMGMKIPIGSRRRVKLAYTLAEFALAIIASLWGGARLLAFLFLIVVVRNALLWERRDRIFWSLATLVLFVGLQYWRLQFMSAVSFPLPGNDEPLFGVAVFSLAVLFGLIVLFLQWLMDAWQSDYGSRCQLEAANDRLRQYALRIEDQAALQERNRIARDIHDALGHSLTALNVHLQAARKLAEIDPAEARELLTEAEQLSAKSLQDVRQSIGTLRADPLQGRPMEEAIAPLLASFKKTTGISPTLARIGDRPLPKDLRMAFYRIVQEALTNIAKYADATTVSIRIAETSGRISLEIADDGRGFEPSKNTTGFGLQGMKERSLALGGEFAIESAPGRGCRIRAIAPFEMKEPS